MYRFIVIFDISRPVAKTKHAWVSSRFWTSSSFSAPAEHVLFKLTFFEKVARKQSLIEKEE
jgi:hypothetical protein